MPIFQVYKQTTIICSFKNLSLFYKHGSPTKFRIYINLWNTNIKVYLKKREFKAMTEVTKV